GSEEGEAVSPKEVHSNIHPRAISSIFEDSNQQMWFGSWGKGLSRMDTPGGAENLPVFSRFHDVREGVKLGGYRVTSIMEDRYKNLWVATDGQGLMVLDRETDQFVQFLHDDRDSSSVANDKTYDMYEDRQGNLWFGHFPSGVSMLDRYAGSINSYGRDTTPSLSHSAILSVLEDSRGNLWIGTEGGLNYLNRTNNQVTQFRHDPLDANSLSANVITSILEASDNTIWLATWGGGLNRFTPGNDQNTTGTFKRYQSVANDPHSLKGSNLLALFEDKNKVLWLSTREYGISFYREDSDDFQHFQGALGEGEPLQRIETGGFFQDRQGNLWLLNYKGVVLLDPDTKEVTIFPDYWSRCIIQDREGFYWMGSNGYGLHKFQFDAVNKTFTRIRRYTQEDGLPNNTVTSIVEDAQGDLWVSTEKGVSHFDAKTERFRNYDTQSGLAGNVYNRNTGLLTSKNELVFGSTTGLSIFKSSELFNNDYVPPVVMTNFQILNKNVGIRTENTPLKVAITKARDITLTHQQLVFSFEFAALNYLLPENNRYAYQLQGFDDDWINSGTRRRATYTNLNAGSYIFRVKGANNDGVWNQTELAINLRILPPWWRTWWAYSFYGLIFGLLIFWFIYTQRQKVIYQMAKVVQEQEKVEQERLLTRRLQEVDKLKDEFLANTSHELRTPLHGIIGLAESLSEGVSGTLPKQANEHLAMIVTSGRRLANLVNDILDFSKLKNHNLALKLQPVDLYSQVQVVLALSKPLIGTKKIVLNNHVSPDLPPVDADENRLQQILYNLVGNAIKFTDIGVVSVVATSHGLSRVLVSIEDTGIGIPESKRRKIFESFEQVSGAEDRIYGGTGLGLALTRRLVQLHGGDLWVRSVEGEGSVFSFALAQSSEVLKEAGSELGAGAETELGAEYSHSYASRVPDDNCVRAELNTSPVAQSEIAELYVKNSLLNVLVVDDEPVNCQVLINYLGLRNYNVMVANSGAEALDIVQREGGNVDIVLLDVMMPCMSGYQVCETLRESYSAQELPVIFLTAKNSINDLVVGFAAGANDFITKPVAKEELLARVGVHLQLLEVNRNLEQKVIDRTEALNKKHELLKHTQSQLVHSEKMAGLSTLVAGVAHEFNNPASMVHVRVVQHEKELKEFKRFLFELTDDDEVREAFLPHFGSFFKFIETMQEGTDRINSLVTDLRLFSSLGESDFKVTKIGRGLRACQHLVSASYDKRVIFDLQLEDDPEISCYPAQLNQAVMNVVLNGCQAIVLNQQQGGSSEPGHLTLVCRTVNKAFDNEPEQRWLAIECTDVGCGMSPDTRERMFEPFFTTHEVGDGTGLGLSITYGIIERHKGRIEVRSELGEGTCLFIYLPLLTGLSVS
ncbi:MAG: hypothetical protein COA42_14905, partial [Alteromonadaceae bacterium]